MEADTRLATYGSLGPGRPNHHQLAMLRGKWLTGTVRGKRVNEGWGAKLGFPALVLDPHGAEIEVSLLESPDLQEHWSRLDAFEGDEYQRVIVDVETATGRVPAWIYVAARG